MATILSIYRYIYTVLVVVTLCTLPTCDSSKMRKLNANSPASRELRLIKVSHKRISRRLEKVRTLEEFIQVFDKKRNAELTVQELLLDQTLPGQRGNIQRLVQRPHNEQNASTVSRQMQEQMDAIECREPRPVILNTYEVMGLTQGLLQYIMPRCIQVNRCGEHSGCCQAEGKSCRVAQGAVRNVTRQVATVNVYIGPNHKPRTSEEQIRTIEVEEHTRCVCKQVHKRNCGDVRCPEHMTKDPISCRCSCPKRCPTPYVNNADTCNCECGMDSTPSGRQCRKIYRGKDKITQNECRCIRMKQCNVPICRSKHHFDNTTCNCTRNQNDEKTVDGFDSYGGIFEADINTRSQNRIPPGELSSNEEPFPAEPIVGSMAVPMVRSMQTSGSDGGNQKRVDPKLGDISPEASEYRHSSHTSYNDTHSAHANRNASGSTKTKLTVWEKSSDDLNATNIKDKYTVSLKSNGTEHQTISTRKSANLSPLPNAVPHLSEVPTEDDDKNFINALVLGEEEIMVTLDTGESSESYPLMSTSDSISYSIWNPLDKVTVEKEEDILDVFSDDVDNEDLETYKFTESSGDYKFGGY